ncbi:MAG TPA: glycogen-debranching protein [Gammaproteobacteria bacterium]|nr:glycogen-debranching protein [Gammaproteobacteria bacterium]
MNNWQAREGSPRPLGVSFIAPQQAWNFALYSKHASTVTLHLYHENNTQTPIYSYTFNPLQNKSGRIWHCRLPAATIDGAQYYAYQLDGPFDLQQGHRFNPHKSLLDPYSRAVFFPPSFDRQAAIKAGPNIGRAPLGVLHTATDSNTLNPVQKPQHTHDTVIYELHVKGFTRHAGSAVPSDRRGTFSGLVEKIPYLQSLGITAVELMPIFQFDPQENDYWGYMPLSFFAPHHLYGKARSAAALLDEFRDMVNAFHHAHIEVILDVVYNHTGEGNEHGPTYSFRGLDNTTYYLLENDRRYYRNDAGTGNVLHTANRYVRSMVLDSLRYWVREMHVDGFRFDLASIFTRRSDGSVNLEDAPIISAIRSDPDLAEVRLIAEAWDISSYQLGRSFPGISWQQWNGKFRDDIRRFVRGDSGLVNSLIQRLYGSDDLFPDSRMQAYHPYQSVNFITAHDGFTLYDLVSYNNKHNQINGHNNSDGSDHNYSWNSGWEGDKAVPEGVMHLRRRQIKNFCCLLMLANGTPMLRAGDEFMQTQSGNNNPYNQDNEISWLNWDRLEDNREMFRFFQKMIAFRKNHPSLGRSRFWREDVHWYGVGPDVDRSPDSHSLAYYLSGASQKDRDIYVMINAWWEDLIFTVQEGAANNWHRIIDTARDSPHDIIEERQALPLQSMDYPVEARSVVVLVS